VDAAFNRKALAIGLKVACGVAVAAPITNHQSPITNHQSPITKFGIAAKHPSTFNIVTRTDFRCWMSVERDTGVPMPWVRVGFLAALIDRMGGPRRVAKLRPVQRHERIPRSCALG
jgi:hypothetical protein